MAAPLFRGGGPHPRRAGRFRILALLFLAGALAAQQVPPVPPGLPVKVLRLKVDAFPARGSGLDLDARQVTADLEAFLATRGIAVLPAGKPAPEGTFELEVAPIALRYPEGTCLLAVDERLALVASKEGAPQGWDGSFMAAQAGDEGLVYRTRYVVVELAAALLQHSAGATGPLLRVPPPSFKADDPPARRPLSPWPAAEAVETAQARIEPPAPDYPSLALARKVEGTVVVLLTIDPDGRPARAVAASGPPELKAAALRYAMQWIFEPVKVDGKPVWARFRLPIPFRLEH